MVQTQLRITALSLRIISCFLIGALTGCLGVGPKSVGIGRAQYAEVINRTEDEQMLLSIVRGRYNESMSLLAVTGIAANVRVASDTGLNFGFGPDRNFAGNLVPFSGGVSYEENPTISYTPIQGERYYRQLMTPIPLDLVLMTVRSSMSTQDILTLLVKRINGLRNPEFSSPAVHVETGDFERCVALIAEMSDAGMLEFATDPERSDSYQMILAASDAEWRERLHELLRLVEIPIPEGAHGEVRIPLDFAVGSTDTGSIEIATRSTFDLTEILRASVDVPAAHVEAGVVLEYPAVGLAGEGVRVRSSENRPENASTMVRYRNYWFYIEDSDHRTKTYFRALKTLWALSIATAADAASAPVLTLPVTR